MKNLSQIRGMYTRFAPRTDTNECPVETEITVQDSDSLVFIRRRSLTQSPTADSDSNQEKQTTAILSNDPTPETRFTSRNQDSEQRDAILAISGSESSSSNESRLPFDLFAKRPLRQTRAFFGECWGSWS
jgi:hypothetical protein